MADSTEPLTKEQKAAFVAWLNEKTNNHSCPACGQNDWQLADHLVAAPIYSAGKAIHIGTVYPQFLLTCNNCLFARYFLALPTNIFDEEGEDIQPEEKSDG